MRKEYRKALRTLFPKRLRQLIPEFEPTRVSSIYVMPGERTYRWIPVEPVHCWIILNPSPKGHQSFTVEVGWSVHARFPELSVRPSPLLHLDSDSAYPSEECVVRVAELRSGADVWWQLPDPAVENPGDLEALQRSLEPVSAEEARAAVEPLVEDAVLATRDYGLPFLKGFVSWYSARASRGDSGD